jgi:radical SAM superfamily enzyme YgiQ (UPF0313 family)
MYKGTRFKIKPDEVILSDITEASKRFKGVRRMFICDGDALIIPQKRLRNILMEIKKQLPWITRVGIYANTKGIGMKTSDELKELRESGLGIAYMGLETGDDVTLEKVRKGADAHKMIEMGKKMREAGIRLSVTVLLGIAGAERSEVHARETGRVISAIDPEYVGALSLMLVPGTPMYEDWQSGRFKLPGPQEMLRELRDMIAHTDMRGQFHANHASNYLPIKARLPKDKEDTLRLIDQALAGRVQLKPEWMRAL